MVEEVRVTSPSRLHFGMIDLRGDLGRLYCSVGVAIQRPRIMLIGKKSKDLIVKGPISERAKSFADKMLKDHGIGTGIELAITEDIPEHVGLGSGTQLALSVGTAVSHLYGLSVGTEEIAQDLYRGGRSAVGTYAFKLGGFIVDGGHDVRNKEKIPPLVFRCDVPEDWLFVVGLPSIPQRISGPNETAAFSHLQPPSSEIVGEISRIVLIQMMPSLLEADIESFGSAASALDSRFGDMWTKIQGGRYSHPLIEAGTRFLSENGAYCIGQSSWGPAFYGLAKGASQGDSLRTKLQSFLQENGGGNAFIASPSNTGASVKLDG